MVSLISLLEKNGFSEKLLKVNLIGQSSGGGEYGHIVDHIDGFIYFKMHSGQSKIISVNSISTVQIVGGEHFNKLEDLLKIPKKLFHHLFVELDETEIILFLGMLSNDLQVHVLGGMSERSGQFYKEQLEGQGPYRQSDREALLPRLFDLLEEIHVQWVVNEDS